MRIIFGGAAGATDSSTGELAELITPPSPGAKPRDYRAELAAMVPLIQRIMRVLNKNKAVGITFAQMANIIDKKVIEPVTELLDYMEEHENDPWIDDFFKQLVKLSMGTIHHNQIDKTRPLSARAMSWVLRALKRFYKYINLTYAAEVAEAG